MTEPLVEKRSDQPERLLEALERCRPRLKQILASFHLPKHEAEDLLQDLIVLAIQKLQGIEILDSWLPATARYLCLANIRKKRRRLEALQRCDSPSPPAPTGLDLCVDLAGALAVLPPKLRTVVILRAMGYRLSEIAGQMGHHTGTVHKLERRGMVKLAMQLGVGTPAGGGSRRHPDSEKMLSLLCWSYRNPGTRRLYLSGLRAFAGWLGSENVDAAVADLLSAGQQAAQETVSRYRAALLERGFTESTVRHRISALRAAVRLAARHGLVDWQLRGPL